MQAAGGPLHRRGVQRQIAIEGGRIKEGVSGEVEQHKIARLGAYQTEVAQLVFDLVTCRGLALQIRHIFWLPAAAFGIDQQLVQGACISLHKR